MDKRITSIVSYITIVGWVLAFIFGDRKAAKFYLNQSLVLTLANFVVSIVASVIPFLSFVFWVIDVILVVLMILGIYHAIMQDDKPLPIIGNINIL